MKKNLNLFLYFFFAWNHLKLPRRKFRAANLPVANFPSGVFSRGKFSARWIFHAANFPGANFPSGEFSQRRIFPRRFFPAANFLRGEFSRGEFSRRRIFPRWIFTRWIFPRRVFLEPGNREFLGKKLDFAIFQSKNKSWLICDRFTWNKELAKNNVIHYSLRRLATGYNAIFNWIFA